MPSIKKVRNWKDYNKSLKKRGEIIFSFDENYLEALYYSGEQGRGGAKEYSDKMYEFLLTIKIMFRMPWRATVGFAERLLTKIFPGTKIKVPDYAHASRMANKLNLKVKQFKPVTGSGIELAFDSTGVNIYTTSGWHQKKYGKDNQYQKRNQWKKIHIALDLDTLQVMAAEYTNSNTNDCEVVKKLCDKIGDKKVKSVRADGAYDTEEFYQIIDKWGAVAMIPPARTSRSQDELKNRPKIKKAYLSQRDNAIKEIRKYENFEEGLKAWKVSSGYHRRSLVEASMFRIKKAFGFSLHQKTEKGRLNEVITKINILNLMASFGKAEYSS